MIVDNYGYNNSMLNCKLSANVDFFVVGIHTQPSRASTGITAAEINELVNVYNTFRQYYGTDIGFVMGDYNYGGSYVSPNQQDNLNIDQPPFVRFINRTDGTTVAQNPKPYDRIYIVPGGITIQRVGIDTFRDMLTPQQVIQAILAINFLATLLYTNNLIFQLIIIRISSYAL